MFHRNKWLTLLGTSAFLVIIVIMNQGLKSRLQRKLHRGKIGDNLTHIDDILQNLEPVKLLSDCNGVNQTVLRDMRSETAELLSDESVLQRSSNCQTYFEKFVDILRPRQLSIQDFDFKTVLSKRKYNESEIPVRLAFSILVHENIGIFETLLNMIFRPYHSYCVHVDIKAKSVIQQGVANIIKCFKETFPNTKIFPADFPISVSWGDISMVDAELQCLQLLYDRNHNWKYYINLAGSEMPLVAIDEIEGILSSGNIENIVRSYPMPEQHAYRYQFSHKMVEDIKHVSRDNSGFVENLNDGRKIPHATNIPKRMPPFNMTIFKGLKYVVLNRKFVNFILHHPVAIGFRRWCEDMFIPDESFYSTLVNIKNVSGIRHKNIDFSQSTSALLDILESTYSIEQDRSAQKSGCLEGFCVRRALWHYTRCKGLLERDICHLSVEDLPLAVNQPHCSKPRQDWIPSLFINKLDIAVDPLAVRCLAQHVLALSTSSSKKCPTKKKLSATSSRPNVSH